MDETWFSDIEDLLNDIRANAILLEKLHRKQFFYYKGFLKYFRIPSIVLNGINSVLSVAMSNYVSQDTTSATTCSISLFIAIINSIEIYLSIQKNMENEYIASKEYYNLAVEIYRVLILDRDRRGMSGKVFLEGCFNKYQKLTENSNMSQKKINDQLLPLDHLKKNRKHDGGNTSGEESSSSEGGSIGSPVALSKTESFPFLMNEEV